MDSIQDMLPLPSGTFYVLLALHRGPMHGYGIKKAVRELSEGKIDLDAGGLYRLIARLERAGFLRVSAAPAGATDDERRRVFYRLTAAGERLAAAEARRLAALVEMPEVLALLKVRRS